MRAPSAIAFSLAQTTSSVTRPMPGRGVEAAIGAGHHAMRVADRARDVFEPVGDDLRMLDKPGQVVDDPGDDDLVIGQRKLLQHAPFVLMPRVGEGQHKAADIGLFQQRQDLFERHVAIVRPLVIAPADMQSDAVARNVGDGAVDRLDDALDKAEEVRQRPLVVGRCRSSARSGQSSCSRNPFATILSYSILSAAASAAR